MLAELQKTLGRISEFIINRFIHTVFALFNEFREVCRVLLVGFFVTGLHLLISQAEHSFQMEQLLYVEKNVNQPMFAWNPLFKFILSFISQAYIQFTSKLSSSVLGFTNGWYTLVMNRTNGR